jgi:biopolymer transport protein ExbD
MSSSAQGISISQARALIRKAKRRVPEGENISHLNITPMMDMMTILLVFLIKSLAAETSTLSLADASLPVSSTKQQPPTEAVSIIIGRENILIEGKPIVKVKNGDVDASDKTEGALGIEISKVKEELAKHHARIKAISAQEGKDASNELTIIADKDTPFRLLSAVMYTAGQAEFGSYRMIVVRNEE